MPRRKSPFPYACPKKDRHGGPPFWYYQRRGHKLVPLGRQYGSPEFVAAYATAVAGAKPVEIGENRTEPGTVDALVVSYYRSEDWTNLAPETRKTRRRYIERFRVQNGCKRVASLTEDAIRLMMAAIPRASTRRHWFKAIRGLLKSAVPTMIKVDPFRGIDAPKMTKSKGHHTWTAAEIEKYRTHWKLGTKQRLVMELALESISRRCEVAVLGPQHLYRDDDGDMRLRIDRRHGSDEAHPKVTAELQAAIDAGPRGHLTFLTTEYGKPYTVAGLGNAFQNWAKDAGLPPRCRLHGLKKGGMRDRAEAGYTVHELMADSGHLSVSEVQRYTRAADRKKLSGSGFKKRKKNAVDENLEAPITKTSG